MERIGLAKKRMIYPERLQLDSLLEASMLSRVSSWTNSEVAGKSNDNQVHPITSLELLECIPRPIIHQSSSTDNLGQIVSDRLSTLNTICRSNSEISSILHRDGQMLIHQRIRELVRAFTERALRTRHRLELPPTPSTLSSEQGESSLHTPPLFQNVQPVESNPQEEGSSKTSGNICCLPANVKTLGCKKVLDPQGSCYILWLFFVTLCYTYNCWVIPLRSTFPFQTAENTPVWLALDYIADAVYLLDVLVFKPRLMYLCDGFWVHDPNLTRQRYYRKWQFKMDVLCLLPLDVLYFVFGSGYLIFRLPRLLKLQTFWKFYNQLDSMLKSPYIVRMARTLSYMLFLIHVNACAYYAFSTWEGLGSNKWVFNGQGNAYIRCFYFATKTATSIGKNPKPENEQEYLFMTCSWLMGVFVFALLIGQMRDIVVTATRTQTEYRTLLDETLKYMRRLNLPQKVQERVKLWFTYTWEQQHTIDESRILDTLPQKLKTDVAINVHIQTLSKVQLFHDCDQALLRDLVLKLKSVIFLPGDFICRKGEVGKEMYIIKTGQVEVMGGDDNSEVLATLTEGTVFGEISLLALAGGNRRTATVKSKGFSNLFVLNKSDLNEAIVHYPEAQEILKRKANYLMRQNALREKMNKEKQVADEVIIGNNKITPETPKLVHTVIQVMGQLDISSGLNSQNSTKAKDEQNHPCCSNLTKCDSGSSETTFQCSVTVHREMSQ